MRLALNLFLKIEQVPAYIELNKNYQFKKTMKKLLIMNYIATIISNFSNGYIHIYWTGPPTFTSYGKCTGRCSIESKNDEGISSQVCILS
jgi:hypothetical protein